MVAQSKEHDTVGKLDPVRQQVNDVTETKIRCHVLNPLEAKVVVIIKAICKLHEKKANFR